LEVIVILLVPEFVVNSLSAPLKYPLYSEVHICEANTTLRLGHNIRSMTRLIMPWQKILYAFQLHVWSSVHVVISFID
jgi:hypothetical protein